MHNGEPYIWSEEETQIERERSTDKNVYIGYASQGTFLQYTLLNAP